MVDLEIFKKNLDKFLKETTSENDEEKMRMICDKIQREENLNIVNKDSIPKKEPAMLLKVEVPGIIPIKDVCFLCLEKDFNQYITSLWAKQKDVSTPCKRTICWEINESTVPKILNEFEILLKSFVERR